MFCMFRVSRCVPYSPGGGCEEKSCQRTVEAGQASRPGLVSNGEPLYRRIAAVQRIFAAAHANGIVACHHGAGPGVSAQFVKMGSKLCQIGNEMRMLTTATPRKPSKHSVTL